MSKEVLFFGESFRLADEPSEWAMLEFAEVAGDTDAGDLAGLGAVMRLLSECIHPDDWQRFRKTARTNRAKIEQDLMPIVVQVFTQEAARPTQQPSDFSAGLSTIEPNSTVRSSGPVTDRLLARPDLMVIVEDAQASRAS